jgi:hypothetical protein
MDSYSEEALGCNQIPKSHDNRCAELMPCISRTLQNSSTAVESGRSSKSHEMSERLRSVGRIPPIEGFHYLLLVSN